MQRREFRVTLRPAKPEGWPGPVYVHVPFPAGSRRAGQPPGSAERVRTGAVTRAVTDLPPPPPPPPLCPSPGHATAPTRCASSEGRGSPPCCRAPPSRRQARHGTGRTRHGTARENTARHGPSVPPRAPRLLCPRRRRSNPSSRVPPSRLPRRDGTGQDGTSRPDRSPIPLGFPFGGLVFAVELRRASRG